MFLAVVFSILLLWAVFISEYKEGMIMLQDGDFGDVEIGNGKGGIREHFLFKALYHSIATVTHTLIAFSFLLLGKYGMHEYFNNYYYIPYIIGMVFLMYQVSEMSYTFSRYGTFWRWKAPALRRYENVWFMQFYSFHVPERHLRILYFGRTITGLVLIIFGFLG